MVFRYEPLRECDFSHKIQLCYFSAKEFYCELNMEETLEIYKLFDENKRLDSDSSRHNIVMVGSPVSAKSFGSQMRNIAFGVGSTSYTRQSPEDHSKSENGGIGAGGLGVPDARGSTYFSRQPSPASFPHTTSFQPERLDNSGVCEESPDRNLLGTNFGPNHYSKGARDKGQILPVQPSTEAIHFNSATPPSSTDRPMESAHSSMNCSPTGTEKDGGTCKSAVVTQQMAVCLGNNTNDRSTGQPLQVVIQTQTEVGSPMAVRPGMKSGLVQDTEMLKDEIQHLKREVENLKRDNARIREVEAVSRHRAENDQAFIRSQMEIGRNASNNLLEAKWEGLKTKESMKSLQRELEAAKDELQNKKDEIKFAQDDLHAAQRAQQNLLKIQNDYMRTLEVNEKQRKDLSARVKELCIENERLKREQESDCSAFSTSHLKNSGK